MNLREWLWELFVAVDQFVNVLLAPVLNTLLRPGAARFGSADETLSSVMGKNSRAGTCRVCSWICRYILHPIDKNHCIDSIEEDEGWR